MVPVILASVFFYGKLVSFFFLGNTCMLFDGTGLYIPLQWL